VSVLVLGIGNLLWADEGLGIRTVEALAERWRWPEHVTLLDGGTQGLYLVPQVSGATHLLVIDAIDFGDAPGTLRVLRDDEVPQAFSTQKMSLHQSGLADVLAAAALLDRAPAHVTLVGMTPAVLEDFGGSLSAVVAARFEDVVTTTLLELARFGVVPTPRDPDPAAASDAQVTKAAQGATSDVTSASDDATPHGPLGRTRYEAERPSADLACRFGDARFL
jgi:hydrogenase maturation protease